MTLASLSSKAKQYGQICRHFDSPLFVIASRLGWPALKNFSYQLSVDGTDYAMLGRPTHGDLWVMREVLIEQTYKTLLPLLPPRPLRVVDVGAHIGSFTVWLHRTHGIAEAFCFEPDFDSFSLCEFNLRRNKIPATVQQRALGGTTREEDFWSDATTAARHSLQRRATTATAAARRVQVVGFAEWLGTVSGRFDVLKLDCEGAEWELLDNAVDAFSRFDIVVAEVHHDPTGAQRNARSIGALLAHQGFTTVSTAGLFLARQDAGDTARAGATVTA